MKRRQPKTSGARRRDGASSSRELVGGVFQGPFEVAEPKLHRPDLVLWMLLPEGRLAHVGVLGEPPSTSFADTLRAAFRKVPGPRSAPERVRVSSEPLAAELRAGFGNAITVQVAPTPELEDPLRDLTRSLGSGENDGSYLSGGRISEDAVHQLFSQAARLWESAPWEGAADAGLIRVDAPDAGVHGACAVIIGGLGESFGVLLFPSLAAFERFSERADDARMHMRRKLDLGTDFLSLEFVSAEELSPTMLREIDTHGWRVPDDDAYPVVERRTRSGKPVPATEAEILLMAGCASALTTFCIQHEQIFGDDEVEPVSVSYGLEGFPTIRLTYPPEGFGLFGSDPGPPGGAAQPRVGRNDPCPCGSGSKYKRCCLDADAAAGQGRRAEQDAERRRVSERNPVHALDERLVEELRAFASARFGTRWKRAVAAESVLDPQPSIAWPWSVYGVPVDDLPIVAHFLEAPPRRLEAAERSWLEAQRAAWLSLWECLAVEPGQSLRMRDLLTGEERNVEERAASETLGIRDTLLARIVDHGGSSFLCGCHSRVLGPSEAAAIVDRVRTRLRRKGAIPREKLRAHAVARDLMKRWDEAVCAQLAAPRELPRLVNRDGEEILLTVDRFSFDGKRRSEIERRLSSLPSTSPAEREGDSLRFAFLAFDNPEAEALGSTILGFATLEPRGLRVETNSIIRADALRLLVETHCGDLLRHRVREHVDPTSAPVLKSMRERPRPETPPEAKQLVLDWKSGHYAGWPDEHLPALGGRTPRETVRTAEGRRAVDTLLKEMEHMEGGAPKGERYDFSVLRRELGLER